MHKLGPDVSVVKSNNFNDSYVYHIQYTPIPVDSCKPHVVVEGKIKALATVAKSKPIRLAIW